MNWDTEEEILLIDLYHSLKKMDDGKRKLAISNFSEFLKARARQKGITVNDKFRNVTGIKMKLQNIEYIATDGQKGLSCTSDLDKTQYKCSILSPAKFSCQVHSIKNKYRGLWKRFFAEKDTGGKLWSVHQQDNLALAKKDICVSPIENTTCINAQKAEQFDKQQEKANLIPISTGNVILGCAESKDDEHSQTDYNGSTNEINNGKIMVSNKSFADIFNKDVYRYENLDIDDVGFSVRLSNCLKKKEIKTISQLLMENPGTLKNIPGFGAKCFKELFDFFSSLPEEVCQTVRDGKRVDRLFVYKYASTILDGSFLLTDGHTTQEDLDALSKYREAFQVLGGEMVSFLRENCEKLKPFLKSLNSYANEFERECKRKEIIFEITKKIPVDRLKKKAIHYIRAFTTNDTERQSLFSQLKSEDLSIEDFAKSVNITDSNFRQLQMFFSWCSFSIKNDLVELFNQLSKKPFVAMVLKKRANGETLAAIGDSIQQTREAIRQKESKAKSIFISWQNRNHIVLKISAERNGDQILTPAEIEDYFGEYSSEMEYLLRETNSITYTYDEQLDVFLIGNGGVSERVQECVDKLPDIIKESDLRTIIEEESEINDIPGELLEKAIYDTFSFNGNVYHRSALSLRYMYKAVLSKYYKEGIRIYDDIEIEEFCERVRQEFGNVNLPESKRAISTRIADIGILCGKGKYMPRRTEYIPQELSKRIYKYINDSEFKIIMINTIYSIFEDELVAAGVDNRYYLQGILKELYGNKLFFRKDYVSKDDFSSSFYSEIVSFIKESDIPVSKEQIRQKFPGVSDIVIALATNDESILKYFGQYYHIKSLKIQDSDKTYLKSIIDKFLNDNEPHNVREIFAYITKDNNDLLNSLGIYSQYNLFSVLEFLFRTNYQFDRPFIGQKGIKIERTNEKLLKMIEASDEILISDISSFMKENKYQVPCMLSYINSLNDTHVFKNDKELIRLDNIIITDEIIADIDKRIGDEIAHTIAIKDLSCIYSLPNIGVPWNDWILYSLVKKYSKNFEVGMSSNQLKYAIPLIARRGSFNPAEVTNLSKSNFVQIDNLDDNNIDSLISDYVGIDLEEK